MPIDPRRGGSADPAADEWNGDDDLLIDDSVLDDDQDESGVDDYDDAIDALPRGRDQDFDDEDDDEDVRPRSRRDPRARRPQSAAENAAWAEMRRGRAAADRELAQERVNSASLSVQFAESKVAALQSKIAQKESEVLSFYNEGESAKYVAAQRELMRLEMELQQQESALDSGKKALEAAEAKAKAVPEDTQKEAPMPRAMLHWGRERIVSQWSQEHQLTAQEAIKDVLREGRYKPDSPKFFRAVDHRINTEIASQGLTVNDLARAAARKMGLIAHRRPSAGNGTPSPSGDGDGGGGGTFSFGGQQRGRIGPDGKPEPRRLQQQEADYLRSIGRNPEDHNDRMRWFKQHAKPWNPAATSKDDERRLSDRQRQRSDRPRRRPVASPYGG